MNSFEAPPTPPLEPVAFELVGAGKVMFQRTGDLDHGGTFNAVYVIDADARRTSIALDTVTSLLVGGPSLSPAGDQVAWKRWNPEPEGCYSVYVTDLTGARPRRLSYALCNSEDDPSWIPSGLAVVFPAEPVLGVSGIYQRELQTDSLVTLRSSSAEPETLGRCFRFGPVSVSAYGAIAFACFGGIHAAETPNDPLTLIYPAAPPTARVYSPTWSLDGTQLAFLELLRDSVRNDGGWGAVISTSVKVLDRASGAVRTVVAMDGSGGAEYLGVDNPVSLCWSPDGTKLIFSAPRTGVASSEPLRANLYVVGIDGSGLVQLTTARDAFDYNVSCAR